MGENKLSELYLACRKKIIPLPGVEPGFIFPNLSKVLQRK